MLQLVAQLLHDKGSYAPLAAGGNLRAAIAHA